MPSSEAAPVLTACQVARLMKVIEAEGLAREALYLWAREQSAAPLVGHLGSLPAGMTSPFDELMRISRLAAGFVSPDGARLPCVAMRAGRVAALRRIEGMALLLEHPDLSAVHDHMQRSMVRGEVTEACPDMRDMLDGSRPRLNEHHAIRLPSEGTP